MKLITFEYSDTSITSIGAVINEEVLDLHKASSGDLPADMIEFLRLGEVGMKSAQNLIKEAAGNSSLLKLAEVNLLAPVPRPGKILHTSCNFGDHLNELTTWSAPEWQAHDWGAFHFQHPTGFLQAPSCIVGSGTAVVRPEFTEQLDHEIELGIIIGKTAKNVSVEDALNYVAGYAVFNDMSARDIQAREHENRVILLGKSFDTSCPLGPYLVTTHEIPDPNVMDMELRVNGKVHQKAKTGDMIYKTDQLVSWWSNVTLEPGDLITSGSPPGVIAGMKDPKWLDDGDIVEAEIEKLGVLISPIVVE